jgi:hypothetical protein
MTFRVGMKAVCIKDTSACPREPIERIAIKGDVYTIRGIIHAPEGVGLYLVEVVNPPVNCTLGHAERAHPAPWFRPIVEKKTDISIFTRILDDVTKRKVSEIEGV